MIEITVQDRVLIVTIKGEVDHHTCVELREKIDRAFQKYRSKHILFDLGGITFMDSSGIGLLMGRYKKVALLDGKIGVYNVPQKMDKLLKLSGIDKLLGAYTSQAEALSQLA